MANIDDKSIRRTYNGDNMVNAHGIEKVPGEMVRISFLRYNKVTGDHVDEYTVVSQVNYRIEDAKKLIKGIKEAISSS